MIKLRACVIAAALLSIAACSGNPPKVKEGLWEVRGQSIEKPGGKAAEFAYKLCRNHAYDDAALALLKNVKGCTTLVKDHGGGQYESASSCNVAGTTIISNGMTTYKSKESMHSETQAKYSPPLRGKTDETMTQDQQYLGACPAGVKPGDTIGLDGIVRHHE